jgi:hypothetical protein
MMRARSNFALAILLNLPIRVVEAVKDLADSVPLLVVGILDKFRPPVLAEQAVKMVVSPVDLNNGHAQSCLCTPQRQSAAIRGADKEWRTLGL